MGNSINRFVGRPEIDMERAEATSILVESNATDLDPQFIDLAKEVVATLKRAENGHTYSGPVVAVDRNLVIQDVGRNTGIVHDTSKLDRVPKLGAKNEGGSRK
ncbi:hypothetical protein ACFS07_36270 [Undibacterium arcticum]